MTNKHEEFWYDEEKEHLTKALLKAQQAFNTYFDKQGLDGAYFDIELTGYLRNTDLTKRLQKIEINPYYNFEQED